MDNLQGATLCIERESQGIVRIFLSFVNAMVWLLCLRGKPSSTSHQTPYCNLKSTAVGTATSCTSSAITRVNPPSPALSLSQLTERAVLPACFLPCSLLVKEHAFHLHSQKRRHLTKGSSISLGRGEWLRNHTESKMCQPQETLWDGQEMGGERYAFSSLWDTS